MLDGQALVAALLYGKLDGLGEELLFLFSRTGLVHLFSASGFHLAAAGAVAEGLSRPFRLVMGPGRPYLVARLGVRLGLMVFFGAATDWSSPMVRAFVFTALLAGAGLVERRVNETRVFLLSLVAAAALGRGGQLSFILSACGMAGVLYVRPRNFWAQCLGPWAFTLPVTIWCFGLFSPLAPLWNLTFGTLISWLVLPPAILSLVAGAAGLPTAWLDTLAAGLMETLVRGLVTCEARLGWALWVRPVPWALLAVGLLLAATMWRRSRAGAGALAVLCYAGALLLPSPDLALLDVGQGDALLFRQAGAWSLSDAGPPGSHGYPAPVAARLEAFGVGTLDHVVLSHLDLDHRGGMTSLLLRHEVGALWIREAMLDDKGADPLLEAAERASVPLRFLGASAPPGWRCWEPPSPTGNEGSPLCLARTDGARSVLLTGDMGRETEEYFVRALKPFPRAGFLKVPHHGSRHAGTEALLAASGAEVALLGVGARNRYGHPSREALTRLGHAGMRVRRTDREGTVAYYFEAGGAGFTEEITRVGEPSRVKPGTPALTSLVKAWPASVK
jgi:competence protein ComEC